MTPLGVQFANRQRRHQRLRCRVVASIVAVCATLAATPAQAGGSFEIIRTLINDGRADQARAVGKHLAADERMRELYVIFIEALIHKHERNYAEAVGLMRQVLDVDPGFARVRHELAETLYLMGDLEASRHHFEFLFRTVGSESHASLYDRYLLAIRSRRPWELQGSVGFAPSTNINNGSGASIVYVGGIPFEVENTSRSGVGLAYSASGTYRFDLDSRHAITVGGLVSGTSYQKSNFDQLAAESFAEASGRYNGWKLGAGIAASRTVTGWKGYRWTAGPYVSVRREIGRASIVAARLSWRHVNFDTVDAFDGSVFDLTAQVRHVPSPRLALSAGIQANRTKTQFDFHNYFGIRPNLSADLIVNPSLTLHANVAYEYRSYDGKFPLTGTPRRDHRFDVGVGATLPRLAFHDFVPRISYGFHQTKSNVQLYDRTRHSVGFSVTRKY